MSIPPQLSEFIKKHLNALAVLPPFNIYRLGDYGTLKNGQFNHMGNIRDFGIEFDHKAGATRNIDYLSPGSRILKYASGEQVDAIPPGSADAKIQINFNEEGAFFLKAPVVKKYSIADIDKITNQLVHSGKWNSQWKMVSEVYEAQDLDLVISNKANAKMSFTGNPSILQELKPGNDGVTLESSKGIGLHVLGVDGVIALGLTAFKTAESIHLGMNGPNKNSMGVNVIPPPSVESMSPQSSGAIPEENSLASPEENSVTAAGEGSEASPVQLGASAPGSVRPNQEFTARFVAYSKELETDMREKLKNLSPAATQHLGIKECTWKKGTKVKVRLTAKNLTVDPAEDEFIWNGTSQIVDFDVTVADLKETTTTVLKFDVSIDNIVVARLRVDLEISDKKSEGKRQEVTADPIRTAFASYASQDRLRVLDRVSEIVRNGVDVFMDCMSMRPGEKWEPRLEKEIKDRESFLLFWSSSAMKSKWVDMEWRMALKERGINGIEAHPLEPPNLAPPPDELKELHFNDIYIIARKANEG